MDHPIIATLETFDGFVYTAKVGNKTGEDNYYLAISVKGNLPTERTAGKDEKPEDKEKLDKDFKEKAAKLQEKLDKEKACENWTYLVSKWTIDRLLKVAKDFLAEKKDDTKKDEKVKDQDKPKVDDLFKEDEKEKEAKQVEGSLLFPDSSAGFVSFRPD